MGEKAESRKDPGEDEGAPPELLKRQDVQDGIEEALRQAREGDGEPGMTADEVRNLAREYRGMGTRKKGS